MIGLAIALWSASSYVGAFMRASNSIYEVEEGRPFWKLRPVQIAITLVMMILLSIGAVAVVLTGPLAEEVGNVIGLGDAAVTAWDIAKWPVLVLLVSLDVLGALLGGAEREAARLPLAHARRRPGRRAVDRRVRRVRVLRRELRLLQQDLRHASVA